MPPDTARRLAALAMEMLQLLGETDTTLEEVRPAPRRVGQQQRGWEECAQELLEQHAPSIGGKSRDFLHNVLERGGCLSPGQEKWLRDLCRATGVQPW